MADGKGRTLVLLRHAKSAWPDVPDHERPLARRGQRDAPVMAAARTLLIVGHDPAIAELALTLPATTPPAHSGTASDAAPPAMLDRMRAKFPTAAIAVFEFRGNWDQLGPGTARLTNFVTPRDLPGKA